VNGVRASWDAWREVHFVAARACRAEYDFSVGGNFVVAMQSALERVGGL